MTTEQSTVPPPNATLDKDSDEMSRMAAHRSGTVLDWLRPGLSCVVIVTNTRRQCRPLPSEPPPQRSTGAEDLASHTRRFSVDASIGQEQWEILTRIAERDVKYADGLGRTPPRTGRPELNNPAAINQGRTASLIAATSKAT